MVNQTSLDEHKRLAWHLSRHQSRVEVAAEFNLSIEGLRSRIKALYRVLGVRSQRDAVDAARRHGWFVDYQKADLLREGRATILKDVVAFDAFQFAVDVRELSRAELWTRLATWNVLNPQHLYAVVLVLAALVPVDQPLSTLLTWRDDVPRRVTDDDDEGGPDSRDILKNRG